MAKRRPAPRTFYRDIVNAQQELLEWCPNVEGVSKEDLEYTCWACGARPTVRDKRYRPECSHIERHSKNEQERPDNFILLCHVCHREQPDAVPKDVLKYWLRTRESAANRFERDYAPLRSAFGLLIEEFGEFVVRIAEKEVIKNESIDGVSSGNPVESIAIRYAEKSAGQGSRNREANLQWGVIAEIYAWCVANKERVELEYQEFERQVHAAIAARRREQLSLFEKD